MLKDTLFQCCSARDDRSQARLSSGALALVSLVDIHRAEVFFATARTAERRADFMRGAQVVDQGVLAAEHLIAHRAHQL